jgi:hypothetical protein
MNLETLPTQAESILSLTWSDYEPVYNELESRPIDGETVQSWLEDG